MHVLDPTEVEEHGLKSIRQSLHRMKGGYIRIESEFFQQSTPHSLLLIMPDNQWNARLTT